MSNWWRYPRSDGELVNDYHNTKVVSLVGFIRNLSITSSYCHVAIFYVNIIYSRIARGQKPFFALVTDQWRSQSKLATIWTTKCLLSLETQKHHLLLKSTFIQFYRRSLDGYPPS